MRRVQGGVDLPPFVPIRHQRVGHIGRLQRVSTDPVKMRVENGDAAILEATGIPHRQQRTDRTRGLLQRIERRAGGRLEHSGAQSLTLLLTLRRGPSTLRKLSANWFTFIWT